MCHIYNQDPTMNYNWREWLPATSANECCTLRATIDDALNPVIAWQYEAGGTLSWTGSSMGERAAEREVSD